MDELRRLLESDYEAIVRLNAAHVQQTSPMNRQQLQALVAASAYCKVMTVERQVVAFVIALGERAAYNNDNFNWFSSRLTGFLYVDRIVVDAQFACRGIGSKLYDDLFAFARARAIETITCEYNIDPPNPGSRAFHRKFGFKELGTQWIAGGARQVSLQAAKV